MIKLQPGDYVSTEGMTEEQYHAVCKAFMDAGADEGEYGEPMYNWGYIGWAIPSHTNSNITQSGIFRFSKASHDGYFKRIRLLTIDQILCSDNTEGAEMNMEQLQKENDELRAYVERLHEEFSEMIDEYRKGKPVCKLCYGLSNSHMEALISTPAQSLRHIKAEVVEQCIEGVSIEDGKSLKAMLVQIQGTI